MLDLKYVLANLEVVKKAVRDKHAENEHTMVDGRSAFWKARI